MVKFSNNFGKNVWCTFAQNLNGKKYKFLIFKVIKVGLQVNIQLRNLKRSRKKILLKKPYKPYMAKKTIYPGTRGRKNKVLQRPIDFTGTNKVPILG